MTQQLTLGVIAILAGVALGVIAFVPFVAISYRRNGHLTFGRMVVAFGALVYFLAIWTYTLLPLPDPSQIVCATPQLNPFEFVFDIRSAMSRTANPLTDAAMLQLLLNILLFIPLGFFVRLMTRRGIAVIAATGLALSVLIELTQLTGVWGLYPCAYRLFDVDDMLTNTLGALIGGAFSLVLPARHRLRGEGGIADASAPRPVSAGRRLLAMLCDVIAANLIALTAGVGVQGLVYLTAGVDAVADSDALVDAATGSAPLVICFVVLLSTGRTIGNAAVQLTFTGARLPQIVARILRYVGGIGGFLLLGLLPTEIGSWLILIFVTVSVVLVFTTVDRRGLPGLVSGQRLIDSRQASSADERVRSL